MAQKGEENLGVSQDHEAASDQSEGTLFDRIRGLGEKAVGLARSVRHRVGGLVKPLGSAAAGIATLGGVAVTAPGTADAKSFVGSAYNPGNGDMYVASDIQNLSGDVTVKANIY